MAGGERPIFLFDGGQDGFGWAIKVPGISGYNWAMNMDCREPGRAYPVQPPGGVSFTALGDTDDQAGAEITAMLEWADSNGFPLVLWCTGHASNVARVQEYKDAALTDNEQAIDPYTTMILFRHDGSDADAEMVYLGNSSGNDNVVQRNKAGTYTSAGHDIKVDLFARDGSDLWISQGYKIRKWNGGDPGLDASYDTAIEVGLPSFDINKILPLGGSPIAIKPEGVFQYNPAPATAEFRPILSVEPHPDNGKAAFTDGRGRIFYDTVDGHIIVISGFGFMSQQGPTRSTTIDRDTPWGRITAMTADADQVYAAVEPGNTRSQGALAGNLGIVVKENDGGAWTTHTTAVTDQKRATSASVALLTSADALYIGATQPFAGIYVEMATPRTSDQGGAQLGIAYSKSGGSFETTSGVFDGTKAFAHSGPIIVSEGVITDLPQLSSNKWVAIDDPNAGNGDDGLFWMRLTPPSATALTGATIAQIYLIPYRPSLDTGVFPSTSYKIAGALPSILVGSWRGETIAWHDMWTLAGGRVDQLLVTRTGIGLSKYSIGKRALWAVTAGQMFFMPIGADAHPARQPWPELTLQDNSHVLAFSGNDFSEAGPEFRNAVKRVKTLEVTQPGLQAADRAYLYTWWDWDAAKVERHDVSRGTHVVLHNIEGMGTVLYAVWAYDQGADAQYAPHLAEVGIPTGGWETVDQAEINQEDFGDPLKR